MAHLAALGEVDENLTIAKPGCTAYGLPILFGFTDVGTGLGAQLIDGR
jgi:hypothetical protein